MAVRSMHERLLRTSFPRIQMSILVTLTALAGLLASVAMLASGVEVMALRYMLAVGVAYIVFLLLLWLWLRTRAEHYLDIPSCVSFEGDGAGRAAQAGTQGYAGGGGSFDGGGASGNVDFGSQGSHVDTIAEKPLGALAQAEEGAIPLAVILIVLGIALSSLLVIWWAPILFAEILVDAALAAGLYRRLQVLDPQHWMLAAVKRTLVPFILTALVAGAAGWGMQACAPEARSLGQVFAQR
jgi:hypothetical protein